MRNGCKLKWLACLPFIAFLNWPGGYAIADTGGDCVDECLTVPGENVLEFLPGRPCVKPGENIIIQLHQRNLKQLVRGHQSFMKFDPSCLQVVKVEPNLGVYGIVGRNVHDNLAGTIDLIAGINDLIGQKPTDKDADIADITFLAVKECCSLDPKIFGTVICFRPHDPPSRFSDPTGLPIYPCIKFGRVKIDGTKPEIKCPPDFKGECEPLPPPDPNLVQATDNCDPNPKKEWIRDDPSGTGCVNDPLIVKRVYRATDCAGNYSECTQTFTYTDTKPPQITCPPDARYQCKSQVPPPDPNQVFAKDDCDPNPKKEWVRDQDNGGAGCPNSPLIIRRIYRATDQCNNYSECTQTFTVIDDTPPDIKCPPDARYQCETQVPLPDPKLVEAKDNCDPSPVVTHVGDTKTGKGCPNDPLIVKRTYRATDRCGNYRDCVQTFTVIDDTPPDIQCPPDAKYQCESQVPPPDVKLPVAKDNCDPNPVVTHVGDAKTGKGCPNDPLVIKRTYRATDRCGNYRDCTQTFTVVDDTKPEIKCPADAEYQCESEVPAPDPKLVIAKDNCDPNPVVTHVSDAKTGKGCPEDPLIITRTYRATDRCGNYADCQQKFTVVDTTPPVFLKGCEPRLVKVFPNAGECTAKVTLPKPEVKDNCGGLVDLKLIRSDGKNPEDPYDPGETNVWWIATDACGNAAFCLQVVQVERYNLVQVLVEMPGVFQPCTRCVEFKLWNCPGQAPNAIVNEEVVFVPVPPPPYPYARGVAQLRVPCKDGPYNCMTAQDRLHTLRSQANLKVEEYEISYGYPRTWYLATYTAVNNNWLIPGNTDACQNPDDKFIDILDFGVISSEWGKRYPDCGPLCPVSGNACELFPHADINADCVVNTADVSFWLVNLLKQYQNCCGVEDGFGLGPTMRISAAELHARGWDHLMAGDLNGDGWLDEEDVAAFLRGARPKTQPNATDAGQ